MEQLIKTTVKILAQNQGTPITLAQLRTKLEKKHPSFSFSSNDLIHSLSQYQEITIDTTPNSQKFSIKSEKIIKSKNCFDIICANYVDDESQQILYTFYKKISKAGPQGIKYTDLQKKIKEAKKSRSFTLQQISHYCRRLVKIKLIKITHPSKQLLKYAISSHFFKQKKPSLPLSETKQLSQQHITHISPFTFLENSFSFQEFTFDQNMKINQQSSQAMRANGLTINQLIQKLNRNQGKKFISKIFQKLEKDDPEQQIIADREGKNIQLRYWSKNLKIYQKFIEMEKKNQKTITKTKQEENNKITHNNNQLSSLPELNEIKKETDRQDSCLYLNSDSFSYFKQLFFSDPLMLQKLQKQLGDHLFTSFKKTTPNFKEREKSIISFAMTKVLIENIECLNIKNMNEIKNMKRQLNELKIKRYILIINKIEQEQTIAIFQLRQYILQVEQFEGLGKIDRKTLNYILNTLETIQLIKLIFRDIGFTYISSEKSIIGKLNKNIALYKNVSEDDCKIEHIMNDVKILKSGNPTENEVKKETRTKLKNEEKKQQNKQKIYKNSNIQKINFNECKIAAIEYKCIILSKFIMQLKQQYIKRQALAKLKLEFPFVLHCCSNFISQPITTEQKQNNLEHYFKSFNPCNTITSFIDYLPELNQSINQLEELPINDQMDDIQNYETQLFKNIKSNEESIPIHISNAFSTLEQENDYRKFCNSQYSQFQPTLFTDFSPDFIQQIPLKKKLKTSNLTIKESIRALFKILGKYPEKSLSFLYGKIQNQLKIYDLLLALQCNGYLVLYKTDKDHRRNLINQEELEAQTKKKYSLSNIFYKMAPGVVLPIN